MQEVYRQKKKCFFCKGNIGEIDYKDVASLGKFLNRWSKIDPATRTGLCAKHQRSLGTAIKRARQLALLPYVVR